MTFTERDVELCRQWVTQNAETAEAIGAGDAAEWRALANKLRAVNKTEVEA
jgi:hypothetical protein